MVSTLSRPPAVAGTFYPADPRQLERAIDDLLAVQIAAAESWQAALVPHAGWVYSGRIAAAVFARCQIPDRIIVLCPKHRPGGAQWAVAPYHHWQIPGAQLDGDVSLAEQLAGRIDGLEIDATPHLQEHAIEVQLPLLAHRNPDVRVVGITVGRAEYDDCLRLAAGLADIMSSHEPSPLLIISSDMNHFATDQENRRLDQMALTALQQCDPRALYDVCLEQKISMCGVRPAVMVLEALRMLGKLRECQKVAYATSADASGDFSRVVGYAGLLFR